MADISFLEKTKNIKELQLNEMHSIKDFTPITNLQKLEKLALSQTNVGDISFLKKIKNIKELRFLTCLDIKDFSPISICDKLKIAQVDIMDLLKKEIFFSAMA